MRSCTQRSFPAYDRIILGWKKSRDVDTLLNFEVMGAFVQDGKYWCGVPTTMARVLPIVLLSSLFPGYDWRGNSLTLFFDRSSVGKHSTSWSITRFLVWSLCGFWANNLILRWRYVNLYSRNISSRLPQANICNGRGRPGCHRLPRAVC